MNDFDYDNLQKKRIAQGERHRKKSTRKCTLPHEYLTAKQIRERNGELMTYKMIEPVLYGEFRKYPEDIKREYIQRLVDECGATTKDIAAMFGVSDECVRLLKNRLRIGSETARGKRKVKTVEQEEKWNEFIGAKKEKIDETTKESREPVLKVEKAESTDLTNIALLIQSLRGTGAKLVIELTL